MRRALVSGVLLMSGVLAGCSSEVSPPPTGVATSAPAPASQTSATPTPTLAPKPKPTKAQDAAALKKALVGADDLGKPWVQPKKVSQVKGKKGEICPGRSSATDEVAVTAIARTDLTEGRGAGKNIATFSLSTLAADSGTAIRAAYAKDQRACARYQDGNGLFVVRSAEGPTSVAGTEVIASWAERIYFDERHKKLAYARHTLVARDGRVATYLSYAFLTARADPDAEDFGRASRLLEIQLTRNTRVFS